MYKNNTSELEKVLTNTHISDIDKYVEENADDLLDGNRDFMRYMNEKLKEKKLAKDELFIRADISQGYGYKLLTEEKRTKRRDVIIRICYAAEFSLKEVQQALKIYHMDTLYAREPRDAFLMVCFNDRPGSIIDLNELLSSNGMEQLRTSGVQE